MVRPTIEARRYSTTSSRRHRGQRHCGRTIIQLAVDDWTLEKLLTFDADSAELEYGADAEPDADAEDGPSVLMLELVRPNGS